MTDLQQAKDLLASLHHAAKNRSANGSTDMSASSTEMTPQNPHKTRSQANSSGTDDQVAALPQRAVVALWSRLTHVFGNRFESMYGTALNEAGELTPVALTWSRALRACTPEQLATGLTACTQSGKEWPPTLPQFWELCHPKPKPLIHRDIPTLAPRLTGPAREAAREAGKRELATIRQRLGMTAHA